MRHFLYLGWKVSLFIVLDTTFIWLLGKDTSYERKGSVLALYWDNKNYPPASRAWVDQYKTDFSEKLKKKIQQNVIHLQPFSKALLVTMLLEDLPHHNTMLHELANKTVQPCCWQTSAVCNKYLYIFENFLKNVFNYIYICKILGPHIYSDIQLNKFIY